MTTGELIDAFGCCGVLYGTSPEIDCCILGFLIVIGKFEVTVVPMIPLMPVMGTPALYTEL